MAKCQNKYCGKWGAKKRRQKTAYVDKESNWAVLCDGCQKESDEYWQAEWDAYYQACL